MTTFTFALVIILAAIAAFFAAATYFLVRDGINQIAEVAEDFLDDGVLDS